VQYRHPLHVIQRVLSDLATDNGGDDVMMHPWDMIQRVLSDLATHNGGDDIKSISPFVNMQNARGKTVLHYICSSQYEKKYQLAVVDELIKYGANVHVTAGPGDMRSPIYIAMRSQPQLAVHLWQAGSRLDGWQRAIKDRPINDPKGHSLLMLESSLINMFEFCSDLQSAAAASATTKASNHHATKADEKSKPPSPPPTAAAAATQAQADVSLTVAANSSDNSSSSSSSGSGGGSSSGSGDTTRGCKRPVSASTDDDPDPPNKRPRNL
jgi:hypothetical protein